MKLIVVIFVCGLALVQANSEEDKMIAECLNESRLRPEDLEKVTPKVKCFYKCIMEKIGGMKNGAIVKDHMIKECQSTKGTDPCDLAYNLMHCLTDHSSK